MNTNERQLLCTQAVTVGMDEESSMGTVAEGSDCPLSSEEIKDRFFQGKKAAVCISLLQARPSLMFSQFSKSCLCHEYCLQQEGAINCPFLVLIT